MLHPRSTEGQRLQSSMAFSVVVGHGVLRMAAVHQKSVEIVLLVAAAAEDRAP